MEANELQLANLFIDNHLDTHMVCVQQSLEMLDDGIKTEVVA